PEAVTMKTKPRNLLRNLLLWATGLALALSALPALAAEEAAGGGDVSPFSGDVGTALWTLVIFGIVIFVLGKFAWGPVLNILQSRETFVRDSLDAASAKREEAEA